MKKNESRKGVFLLGFGLLFALLALPVATLRNSAQSQTAGARQGGGDEDRVPVVKYGAEEDSKVGDAKKAARRKAVNLRHNGQGIVRDTDTGGRPVITFSHWDAGLPSLPVGQSDLIVIGRVTGAQAHLSTDQTGVYSEFTVNVSNVLKNSASAPVAPGELIVAEREGGRVEFPESNRVTWFATAGMGLPGLGSDYVFFLTSNEQQYTILTAYELQGGRVHPLDGQNAPGGRSWAGNVYEGADAQQFLRQVQDAVVQSPAGK